ncbi:MAG: outer membrane protein assembly factor BamA, partial [Desulfovibrio sp.]|nr:outer membrane protein assembly factor BamA [Desulfovibrio sp.]
MKKVFPDFLPVFLILAAFAVLLAPRSASAAAKPDVLILPFQANAGPELPNASTSLPQMIASKLEAEGLSVVPMARSSAIFNRSGSRTIDLSVARRLAKQAGATIVIYGAFNQLGDGFSMETRLVPVDGGEPIPATFERDSLLALDECAQTLASRAASMRPAPAPTPVAQPGEPAAQGFVPMNVSSASGGLSDVQVRGMNVMDPDTVLMRLSIRKGDNPDADAINEEVKRIW